jgi:hypothetical protein
MFKKKSIYGLEAEFGSKVVEYLVCSFRATDYRTTLYQVQRLYKMETKTDMDGDTETTGEKAVVGYLKAAIPLNSAKSHERR